MNNNITVQHCFRCGSTGKIYDGVPGSVVLGTNITYDAYQSPSKECPNCEGTGHIIGIKTVPNAIIKEEP